ncbi:MAG: ABC transporter permease [Trueperaceae bacterium]|nr:ABC transporter permease [Trueperaceae bacterium]MCO5175317.1 ABC transporter permease [Trueperaceae bacterium]
MTGAGTEHASTRGGGVGVWRRAMASLARKPFAVASLVIIVAFVLVAVFAPQISPYDPTKADFLTVRKAPSAAHLLGTDDVGRDVLSRLIHGARASLIAGALSVVIAMVLGVPLGLIAGFYRGAVSELIMRFTDALLSFPFLILAVALAAAFGPSLTNAMIAIGVASAPTFIRLTRGQVLAVRAEEYVQAASALGAGDARVLWSHVLPNSLAPLLVQGTLTIATSIIAESSLSFLGLGVQPPTPSWGGMLNVAKNFMSQAPWMAIWPGLAIFVSVLAFNLLGDGVRDAFDPRD